MTLPLDEISEEDIRTLIRSTLDACIKELIPMKQTSGWKLIARNAAIRIVALLIMYYVIPDAVVEFLYQRNVRTHTVAISGIFILLIAIEWSALTSSSSSRVASTVR